MARGQEPRLPFHSWQVFPLLHAEALEFRAKMISEFLSIVQFSIAKAILVFLQVAICLVEWLASAGVSPIFGTHLSFVMVDKEVTVVIKY